MRRTRRRWIGQWLAVIWMAARLVLPTQPDCPHHAAASHHAAATHVAEHASAESHAGMGHHAAHAPETVTAQTATAQTATAQHPITEGTKHSAPPSDAAGCECQAHCCAAVAVRMPAPVPGLQVATRAVGTRAPQSPNALPVVRREHLRQPPSTAPPTVRLA